jgi:L-ribulokinase
MMPSVNKFVIGLDFGSDSVRAILLRVEDGFELKRTIELYERWGRREFCDPAAQRYRQHPLDHMEAMTRAVRGLFADGSCNPRNVVGIGVDTTGSSPLPLGPDARPLGLYEDFANDPDALCVLWKDHTAVAEAEEINALCYSGRIPDYTRFVGGIYSSEWFWAKILHVHRASPKVQAAAASWVEFCDWIPALLAGVRDPKAIVRSRCGAGHKALWHPSFGGLPGRDFLSGLDQRLLSLPFPLFANPVPNDHAAGRLCPDWAQRLGLPEGVVIAVGAFDCHMGAVGAGITPYTLARVMGTSTCDILIAPPHEVGDRLVRGICGQVPDSVLPDMIGFEAGQSSFGDVFAWYRDLIGWGAPAEAGDGLLKRLAEAAATLPPGANGVTALDWLNGRRTPDANQRVKAAIAGLDLAGDAPTVYRALVEATAYGGRAIIDRFEDEGIPVKAIVALGGIPKKSPLVMQVCADVFNRPIDVVASEECCARGAGIFAAAAAGEYRTSIEAKNAMQSAVETRYTPDPERAARYRDLFARYQALGAFAQEQAGA